MHYLLIQLRDNTGIGAQALFSNTSGTGNNAVGAYALRDNTTGKNNAQGTYALFKNTTGSNNTGVGRNSLKTKLNWK